MYCSKPGSSALHYFQVHVHWISVTIQPSHPLVPTSPFAFHVSHHQGHFQWNSCSHQVAKVLELQLQHVFPMNIQGWFPLGLTALISLLSKWLSRLFSSTTIWKHQFFGAHPFYGSTLTYMTTGKTIALTRCTFVGKVISLLFNMLSRFVIAFLPRSKCLWISWLRSPSAVILGPPK